MIRTVACIALTVFVLAFLTALAFLTERSLDGPVVMGYVAIYPDSALWPMAKEALLLAGGVTVATLIGYSWWNDTRQHAY